MPACADKERMVTSFPKIAIRNLRRFRYLVIPRRYRENAHLVRERVRCGKSSCRCLRGEKHGPYYYLRYEEWDPQARDYRYRREYVPKKEVRRVRRWISTDRARDLRSRAFLHLFRRYAEGSR